MHDETIMYIENITYRESFVNSYYLTKLRHKSKWYTKTYGTGVVIPLHNIFYPISKLLFPVVFMVFLYIYMLSLSLVNFKNGVFLISLYGYTMKYYTVNSDWIN